MIDVIGPIVIGVITAVILAAIVGYILNIVKLFRSFRTNGPLTPIFFGRILGLVIPVIGSVVGYMK